MLVETYIDVAGYTGIYQVSNFGNIKSLSRLVKHCSGGEKLLKEKILKPNKDAFGYLKVVLSLNKKGKTIKIHQLVAINFLSNPNNKPVINHIDGVKTNNHYNNLEWCTQSENVKHSFDTGLHISVKGEKHGKSKLTEKQVLEIRSIGKNEFQREIAEKYNVSRRLIRSIINRECWTHI